MRTNRFSNRLLWGVLVLLLTSWEPLFSQQYTASSSIRISFMGADGLGALGITTESVDLSLQEIYGSVLPGEPYTPLKCPDTKDGSRLHYSVLNDLQDKMIVVYTDQALPDGLLYVEIIDEIGSFGTGETGNATGERVAVTNSPAVLISDIGSCYTGITELDGPRLRYTLSDYPVSDYITVHYALVDSIF